MQYRATAISAFAPLLMVACASAGVTHPSPSVTRAGSPCGTATVTPSYTHVIWIWMENHSYNSVIHSPDAPYIGSLARQCGVAANYHNITHPSLPNYVAATSGLGYASLARFSSDCDPAGSCLTSAPSIFGQGETWRAYEETMPSVCHKSDAGNYAVRHNPPPYFTSLGTCPAFDVPIARLSAALAGGRLPAFTFITPNLINDMHDGTVRDGNAWLARNLPPILDSPQYLDGSTVVFITWDEGQSGFVTRCATNRTNIGCHVAMIVISPSTKPGTHSTRMFNHYSLLATTEQLLGLPRLGLAKTAATMTAAFGL